MMRGQLGRLPPLSEAAATVRSRGPTGRASSRAADDVLEADLQSDEILACFEEALGERQPEMGTDAAAGREANAESAEAAPRLEAAAEQQQEHSLLAPTAGRGVEPVLPDPVPMLHTNSGGGRRSCEPDAGARQQIGSAAASILDYGSSCFSGTAGGKPGNSPPAKTTTTATMAQGATATKMERGARTRRHPTAQQSQDRASNHPKRAIRTMAARQTTSLQ